MTQPTDRPGINQLTSDMLDQLYGEIDTLRSVCQSNKQAYVGAVKHAWEVEERAKQAEATLTAVRKLAERAEKAHAAGRSDYDIGKYNLATRLLAVLDQHGQTPKETT